MSFSDGKDEILDGELMVLGLLMSSGIKPNCSMKGAFGKTYEEDSLSMMRFDMLVRKQGLLM